MILLALNKTVNGQKIVLLILKFVSGNHITPQKPKICHLTFRECFVSFRRKHSLNGRTVKINSVLS